MPRGVRKAVCYEEELMKIDAQITQWQNTIEELRRSRKQLLEEKERAEMQELYRIVKESGKTPSEILAAVGK